MIAGLHGSYFARNFGDTLLLNIIYNWIKEADPNAEVILPYVSSHKEAVEILNNIETKSYKKYKVSQCDRFIFGGGGYFGEPKTNWARLQYWTLRNYFRHISWNNQLIKNKIPFAIIGVGVGPISNSFLRKKVIKLFDKAEFICVRDTESFNYLKQYGCTNPNVYETTDLALSVRRKKKLDNEKKVLGVHFPIRPGFPQDKIPSIISFLKQISKNYSVKLINDQKGQMSLEKDTNITRFIKNSQIEYTEIEYHDPNKLIDELNELDVILTSKLHVGILGYALKKPVLSIPNHTKNFRFYKQIGRSNFCIPANEVNEQKLLEVFNECTSTPVVHDENLIEKGNLVIKLLFNFLQHTP